MERLHSAADSDESWWFNWHCTAARPMEAEHRAVCADVSSWLQLGGMSACAPIWAVFLYSMLRRHLLRKRAPSLHRLHRAPRPRTRLSISVTELKGFILTRHWRDAPAGTEIEFWLATEDGPKKVVLSAQTSVAFVPARHSAAVEAQRGAFPRMQLRPLALRTFHQEAVIGVYATHFRQLGKLARALQSLNIPLLEADVRPHDRYLMERFILGWNGIQFDLRVLQKTADDCGVKLLLGRGRQLIQWRTHPAKQGYLHGTECMCGDICCVGQPIHC